MGISANAGSWMVLGHEGRNEYSTYIWGSGKYVAV